MKKCVMAVWDTKAGAYAFDPVVAPTIGVAIRAFSEAVADEKSQLSKFPDDFELHQVGTFNPVTGELEPMMVDGKPARPQVIGPARQFLPQQGA